MVAYNKMDIPESADYWEEVREWLLHSRGVPPEDCLAISAVSGEGTTQLVRRLHAVLDALPPRVSLHPCTPPSCHAALSPGGAWKLP